MDCHAAAGACWHAVTVPRAGMLVQIMPRLQHTSFIIDSPCNLPASSHSCLLRMQRAAPSCQFATRRHRARSRVHPACCYTHIHCMLTAVHAFTAHCLMHCCPSRQLCALGCLFGPAVCALHHLTVCVLLVMPFLPFGGAAERAAPQQARTGSSQRMLVKLQGALAAGHSARTMRTCPGSCGQR